MLTSSKNSVRKVRGRFSGSRLHQPCPQFLQLLHTCAESSNLRNRLAVCRSNQNAYGQKFLSNIDSRTVRDFDFQHGSSFEEKPTPLSFTLSRGLESTNRRFVLRRPDYFLNGVISTIFKLGHSSSMSNFQKQRSCGQATTLSSSGVAHKAIELSYP